MPEIEITDFDESNRKPDDDALVISDAPMADEIIFTLPKIPGATDDSEIVLEDDGAEVTDSDEIEIKEADPWDWKSRPLSEFLSWAKERCSCVPKHSGKDTVGLEKAINHFKKIDKALSSAISEDYRDEIANDAAERIKEEIHDAISRLEDRLEKVYSKKFKKGKNKKAASYEVNKMVKTAASPKIDGIVVTVPLFISSLARVCINGYVSAGHDIERLFEELSKKYKLTDREKKELIQLIEDMGFPLFRDRGFKPGEDIDKTSPDNFDWSANYPA